MWLGYLFVEIVPVPNTRIHIVGSGFAFLCPRITKLFIEKVIYTNILRVYLFIIVLKFFRKMEEIVK
jgi:hypothetical protein